MAYVPSSEYQGEIDNLIDEICKSLVFQEKYCIDVPWVDGIHPNEKQKRRPNYEALNHVSPYLSIHHAPHIGHLVQYNQTFIGAINYWKQMEQHFITKDYNIDVEERRIKLNSIISLKNFLTQISNQTIEQVRLLEKVLFCFEA